MRHLKTRCTVRRLKKDPADETALTLFKGAYLERIAAARSRPDSRVGREQAIKDYGVAVAFARHLQKRGAHKALPREPIAQIIAVTCDNGGARLLGSEPDDEIRTQFAKLCASLASLIKGDRATWSQVKEIGPDPVRKALALYDQAYQQEPKKEEKAEYLVLKGLAYRQLPGLKPKVLRQSARDVDLLAPGSAGGFAIEALALIEEARAKDDYKDKIKALKEAVGQLDKALEALDKVKERTKKQELAALLNQSEAVASLELANYAQTRKDRERYLADALKRIDGILKADPRNLDAWNTKGCILEDQAWLLGKTDQYRPAEEAFTKAMDSDSDSPGRMGPWLGRGRTRFKRAESLLGDKREAREGTILLTYARIDFEQVLGMAKTSIEAAEAHYWLGKTLALQKLPAQARRSFEAGLRLTKAKGYALWEEATLGAAAEFAFDEANRLFGSSAPDEDINKYARDAKQWADELAKVSKARARAALVKVHVLRLQIYRNPRKPNEEEQDALRKAFEEGLKEQGRAQDVPYQAVLLSERAFILLVGYELPKDLDQAYADACEIIKLGKGAAVDAGTRASGQGTAGLVTWARWETAKKKDKERLRAEAIEHFREALKLAPNHGAAWEWKAYLAGALFSDLPEEASDNDLVLRTDANLAEEASRWHQEAVRDIPAAYLKSEKYKWITEKYPNTKDRALPILRKAVKKLPRSPDAWKWNWRLAELLVHKKPKGKRAAVKEEALASITRAAGSLPKEVPLADKARVEELLKELKAEE
jgi:tetratricopeptide (TPR) repeat protein